MQNKSLASSLIHAGKIFCLRICHSSDLCLDFLIHIYIHAETKGESDLFEKLTQNTSNPALITLLRQQREEEKNHIHLLEAELKRLRGSQMPKALAFLSKNLLERFRSVFPIDDSKDQRSNLLYYLSVTLIYEKAAVRVFSRHLQFLKQYKQQTRFASINQALQAILKDEVKHVLQIEKLIQENSTVNEQIDLQQFLRRAESKMEIAGLFETLMMIFICLFLFLFDRLLFRFLKLG